SAKATRSASTRRTASSRSPGPRQQSPRPKPPWRSARQERTVSLMGVRRALRAMLAAALLSGLAIADSIAGPAKTNTGTSDYWLVLRSDRDEKARAYAVRPDGSRL